MDPEVQHYTNRTGLSLISKQIKLEEKHLDLSVSVKNTHCNPEQKTIFVNKPPGTSVVPLWAVSTLLFAP